MQFKTFRSLDRYVYIRIRVPERLLLASTVQKTVLLLKNTKGRDNFIPLSGTRTASFIKYQEDLFFFLAFSTHQKYTTHTYIRAEVQKVPTLIHCVRIPGSSFPPGWFHRMRLVRENAALVFLTTGLGFPSNESHLSSQSNEGRDHYRKKKKTYVSFMLFWIIRWVQQE